jgi:hypothetical protein
MSKSDLPRGIRNNNPGNLRAVAGKMMIGEIEPDAEGYRRFAEAVDGIRGLARQILLYRDRGIVSIYQIVSTFAPPNENDTVGYIAFVCRQLNVDPDDPIDASHFETMRELVQAKITMECGKWSKFYTAAQIAKGIENAGVKRPAPARAADPAISLNAVSATVTTVGGATAAVAGIWNDLASIAGWLPVAVVGVCAAVSIAVAIYFVVQRLRAHSQGVA